MKKICKIRKYVNGIFIKFSGRVWRPQVNTRYYDDKPFISEYQEGEKVEIYTIPDVLWMQINNGEYWYSHGYDVEVIGLNNLRKIPTEEVWMK